jgi:hypothetical protein
VFHRYEHVLQVSAAGMVGVRISRGDRPDAQLAGELAQGGVPAGVST